MTTTQTKLATPAEVFGLLRRTSAVALDLETTGLSARRDRIRLLSVSDGQRTVVMDCFEHPIQQLLPALKQKLLVAHNAQFDLGFLFHAGLRELPETVCTYLLAQLLTAGYGEGTSAHGFPKLGLGACVGRWLNQPMDKELHKSDWSGPLSADQLDYAARDAAVLPRLHLAMTDELEKAKLIRASDVELGALPAFVWMSQSGVPFDREAWKTLADQANVELQALTEKLDKAAPPRGKPGLFGHSERWNWSSPQQVSDVLTLLGCPVPSTNDYYLSELKHPIGKLLRKHREVAKRLTTYGHDWLQHVAADGRVYPGWRQLGAAAGRSSCAQPNMQQLPRDAVYRSCVKAPLGWVLVRADYSQIELRLACKIARERVMLDCYNRNEDLHTKTAQLLLGKQEVDKADRQIAKSANFGLLYGMGAPGYRAYAKATYGLDLTEQQAAQYRELFFRAYPGLAEWHNATRRTRVKETRTLTGRRRFLPESAPDTWRLNTPVQGSGADGLKLAMDLLWKRRGECPDARPVLTVHDELVVECPADQGATVKAWLTDCMMSGMEPLLDPVPCAVEAKIVPTWGGG